MKRNRPWLVISCQTAVLVGLAVSGCSSNKGEPQSLYSAPLHSEEELLTYSLNAYDNELYSVARDDFNDIKTGYPASYWTTLAQLKIGDSYFFGADYVEAVTAYEQFVTEHPGHEALPYVRFQIGLSYIKQYRSAGKDQSPLNTAIRKFNEVIRFHPQSPYAVQARRYIDRCRELLARYELSVAAFYLKQDQRESSRSRLIGLLDLYPDTQAAAEAMSMLSVEFGENYTGGRANKDKVKADKAQELAPQTPQVITAP